MLISAAAIYMRTLFSLCLTVVSAEFYSSFTSSSFSSSYSNTNGEEHSQSSSMEKYAERDSSGLNRRGSGKIETRDGLQVFEKTDNCDGDRCTGKMDTGKRRLVGGHLRVEV